MVRTISISELHDIHKKIGTNEMILDVRRPEEFSAGHVPGSKNISHESVLLHANELGKYKNLYLYCHSGARVQRACWELEHAGLKNLSAVVEGGMPDWASAGYPVEK